MKFFQRFRDRLTFRPIFLGLLISLVFSGWIFAAFNCRDWLIGEYLASRLEAKVEVEESAMLTLGEKLAIMQGWGISDDDKDIWLDEDMNIEWKPHETVTFSDATQEPWETRMLVEFGVDFPDLQIVDKILIYDTSLIDKMYVVEDIESIDSGERITGGQSWHETPLRDWMAVVYPFGIRRLNPPRGPYIWPKYPTPDWDADEIDILLDGQRINFAEWMREVNEHLDMTHITVGPLVDWEDWEFNEHIGVLN